MWLADARILLFAKAPRPGEVKTRLIPKTGAEGAALLHTMLVRHALDIATKCALCPVELWCAPVQDDPFFIECANRWPITLHEQQGEDLGARMQHAITDALGRARRVVLIGTDCPALTPELLATALDSLDDDRIDAVFTPALDGGYVLIGLRRIESALFDDIAWGGPRVMAQTRERMRQRGWRWIETVSLKDIDEPEDLAALAAFGIRPRGA